MRETVREVNDSTFEREVLQSAKPVLVDFWAPWCGPCRSLAPTVESIAEQFSETASVVKVNVDDNPSTAGAYGIRSIPTLILFSGGKEVERAIGTTGKESISQMIEKYCLPAGAAEPAVLASEAG